MEKQKICIIGAGLTGLITAITLAKLNIKIDLIMGNDNTKIRSSRTIAISQSNYDFLKKLKVFKYTKKMFWPCSKIKLYEEDNNSMAKEIFEFKKKKKQEKNFLYLMKNTEIIKYMITAIKKNKLITIKNKKNFKKISNTGLLKSVEFKNNNKSKYNLIIICTGANSELVNNFLIDQPFVHSYEEKSITTILKHNFLKNNVARQFFLDNSILAFLPISNTKTSIVWTLKNKTIKKYQSNKYFIFKKKIKLYAKFFLKEIKFISTIQSRDLNLLIRKKYYQDRILLFGDALHVVHPLAGQGFNMILRDLAILKNILKNNINLGLDIGNREILSEFSNQTKPTNFAYSLSIDLVKNFFSLEKKTFKLLRKTIIKKINNNEYLKSFFINIANKGIRF